MFSDYNLIDHLTSNGVFHGHAKIVQSSKSFCQILGYRDNMAIMNVEENFQLVRSALFFLLGASVKRSSILFAGLPPRLNFVKVIYKNSSDASDVVLQKKFQDNFGIKFSYINLRWKGGFLTNYKHFKRYFINNLEVQLKRFPQLMILLYVENYLRMPLDESIILRIPNLLLVDSDMQITNTTYPLMGNNDKVSTILLYLSLCLRSMLYGSILRRYKFLGVLIKKLNGKKFKVELGLKQGNFFEMPLKSITTTLNEYTKWNMYLLKSKQRWKKFKKVIKWISCRRKLARLLDKHQSWLFNKVLYKKNNFFYTKLTRRFSSKSVSLKRKTIRSMKKLRWEKVPLRIKNFWRYKDRQRYYNSEFKKINLKELWKKYPKLALCILNIVLQRYANKRSYIKFMKFNGYIRLHNEIISLLLKNKRKKYSYLTYVSKNRYKRYKGLPFKRLFKTSLRYINFQKLKKGRKI